MISHNRDPVVVSVTGGASARPTALQAERRGDVARSRAHEGGRAGAASVRAIEQRGARRAGPAGQRHGSISIQRDQQGRCQGPCLGAGPFPCRAHQRGFAELYALRALDMPALDVGGPDLLDRYEARMTAEDPFLQTADDMSFFVHGDGAFLKLDQDGRITVTDFMREHTGIVERGGVRWPRRVLPDLGAGASQGACGRGPSAAPAAAPSRVAAGSHGESG